LKTKRGLKAI